jgi:hypothetical protein
MSWEPIRRGKPEVQGVHSEYSGLLRVRIPLEGSVTEEWSHHFLHPTGVGISLSMHPPELSGRSVRIQPPDDELKQYVRHVDERIRAANERYEAQVLPRLEAEANKRANAEERRAQRLEAARRAASGLE